MNWERFVNLNKDLPVILLSNLNIQMKEDPGLTVQLSRWKKSGKLIALKKGVYLLNSLYRKKPPFEPFLSQQLLSPSYISFEKALEFHGLIPEAVPVFTSATTKLPRTFDTPIGTFRYYHLHPRIFWGYEPLSQGNQVGFMAHPEKALLDFIYLHRPNLTKEATLRELRLQNLERLDLKKLRDFSMKMGGASLRQRSEILIEHLSTDQKKDKVL